MTKPYLSFAVALLCSVLMAFSASASDLSGYFRVQNVEGQGYVEVRGPFTAEPDATLENALYNPATVLYVEGDWYGKDGQAMIRLKSLRGQGIEVVGEPIDEYLQTLQELIFTREGFADMNEALWNLARGGSQLGYTAIGRALIQSVITIVAQRLDSEDITSKEVDELYQLATRFNEEVARQIDLSIYLEPMDDGSYRILFVTPNLQCVSDWYLATDDDGEYINKTSLDKGFEAMRQYLTKKAGISTGEGLDPNEIAEMAKWGYNLPDKYKENVNSDGVVLVSYEDIFADPDLLFNWLKLNIIKFTDPERCPDIELQGISLRAVSEELQKHHLTQLLIQYLPGVQQDQRIYLTDGKNGNVGHFDFTGREGADLLGDYAKWRLHEIQDNVESNSYLAFKPTAHDEFGWYASVYVDFPMKIADEKRIFDENGDPIVPEGDDKPIIKTTFYGVEEKAVVDDKTGANIKYHPLVDLKTTKRQQPVIILMNSDVPEEHLIIPDMDVVKEPQPEKKNAHLNFQTPSVTVFVDGIRRLTGVMFKGFTPQMVDNLSVTDLKFTSSNPEVATVDDDGVVTIVGNVGSATITASLEGNWEFKDAQATYTINVIKYDAELSFERSTVNVYIDGYRALVPDELFKGLVPNNMNEKLTLADLKFESSNEGVVSVDETTGVVTINGVEGSARITVAPKDASKFEGSASYTITVTKYTATFKFKGEAESVYPDGTFSDEREDVFEGFELIDLGKLTLNDINFSSSEPDVVSVDNVGKLTFSGNLADEITITATLKDELLDKYKAHSVKYVIEMEKYDADFKYENKNITVYLYLEDRPQPELIIPEDIDLSEITFSSSNPDVVSVDAKGYITPHKQGYATITAKFAGNDVYEAKDAQCIIYVVDDFVVGDDEVVDQHNIEGELMAVDDESDENDESDNDDPETEEPTVADDPAHDHTDSVYRGVFFATTATEDNLKQQGINVSEEENNRFQNDDVDVHLLRTETMFGTDVLWYGKVPVGDNIPANTAFLLRPTGNEDIVDPDDTNLPDVAGFALRPYAVDVEEGVVTGAEDAIIDNAPMQPDRIYNLQGIEVKNPVPGQIYILNGQKILVW